MTNTVFAPEHFTKCRLPLHQASPLPGWCYTSSQWYEREVQTMFHQDWLCLGRAEQIPQVGDYFSIEVTGRPLLVVRDESGQVRVQSALCRHRGAIISEGSGKCRAFVCPYHSWTYNLSGQLIATPGNPPPMAGSEGFCKEDHGLHQVRSETWGGFIFATFNAQALPLQQWLGDLPEFLKDYDLENMVWTHRDTYEVPCNWKIWLENAFENYHVATVHRSHYDPKNPQNWKFERTHGPWEAMSSKRSIVAYSGLPPIPGLDPSKESTLFHIWIQPSVQIILTSSYMKFRQYLPQGPDQLLLYENWTFPRATVERADFGSIVGPDYYEKYSQIVREDLGINPIMQRAMRSGAYEPGRYSLEECILHRIANRVLDRVIGPDDEAQRLSRQAD